MAEVKWIKICTDIFDDEKIMLIEGMPEADSIISIWFKLLCLAGKQNNGGVFMLKDKMPYTEEMFAIIFRRPLNTVRLALNTFETFGMVEVVNKAYTITNWELHQNIDKMEEIREYNRLKQRESRAKKRLLNSVNDNVNDMSMTSQRCQDTDKDIDKDKDKEYKKKINKKESFVSPTLEEVQAYCESRGNKVDAKQFYDYFTASGWIDSKGNKVKSWKQKIITWESFQKDDKLQSKVGANGIAISNEKSDLEGVF